MSSLDSTNRLAHGIRPFKMVVVDGGVDRFPMPVAGLPGYVEPPPEESLADEEASPQWMGSWLHTT